ncbi:MAG TPA: BON domain-containing protein [Candidatus Polarisedimenticolaceae bacterium]|nr:BON domain-containing protein [Candidatus Polarisedimenticolaceae bacterium]
MRPDYSKIWLVVAGTVAGMTLALHAADPDGRIETSAKSTYLYRTFLANNGVEVESSKGIVTLRGSVADRSLKEAAEDTVAALPGVIHVDNRLEVAKRAEDRSSDWIAARVRLSLWSHRSIKALPAVSVVGSVVTLTGQAASLAERDLATEYARDVDGVTDVRNRMIVYDSVARSGLVDDGQARYGSF